MAQRVSDETIRRVISAGDDAAYSPLTRGLAADLRDARRELAEARGLLQRVTPSCENLSHRSGEYHESGERCPVVDRLNAFLGGEGEGKDG